jgi:hypothetical protein
MVRRGGTPLARLLGLWDALDKLFAREDFRDSFPVRAAIAVPVEPGQAAPAVFVEHQLAVRELLSETVVNGAAGNSSVPRLVNHLELLVGGAIAGSAIDQEPSAIEAARELGVIALSVNGFSVST